MNLKNVYLFLLLFLITQANVCQAQTLEEVIGYGLPVVVVNTMDGEEPTSEVITHQIGSITRTSITNAVQKEARMQIYRGGTLWYDSGDYIDDVSGIKIRHRGNTSAALSQRKPYKLKLQKKADLIDTQEDGDNTDRRSKDWVLLNYVKTIELPVAYKLSSLIGLEYTPRMQFVNVIINGDYRGMYVLGENITRDKECRINVDKQDGYIIEFDPYFWNEPLSFESLFSNSMQWTMKYPDSEDITAEQMENIRNDIQRFEASVSSNDYPSVIDVKSIARWMLVHDIMGTRDAAGSNIYVARTNRKEASQMRMPVVWDMAGSSMKVANEWSRSHTEKGLFLSRLFANEQCVEFTKEYVREWKRIKEENIFDSLIAFIDGYASTPEGIGVKKSAPHHMQRWYQSNGLANLDEKMLAAKNWMNDRQLWLDENITKMAASIPASFSLNGDERPVAGNSLSVSSDGDLSAFTFKWTRGDARGSFDDTILSSTKDYAITESDYEHWIRVAICNNAGDTVFTKKTWISKLPVLYINTESGKPITAKKTYVTANLYLQGNAEYEPQYDGTTEIKGRGQTSWANYSQKPYKLKLMKKTNLFGFGKSKHWVLISNFRDVSCLRNYLASKLAKELGVMGMNMTWVDVVVNGEAKGCYMLSQHIRVDKKSVDIFDWEDEAENIADNLFAMVKDADALTEADEAKLEETMKQNLAWITDGEVTFKGKTYNLSDYGLKKEYDITKGYLFEAADKPDGGPTRFTTPDGTCFDMISPEYLCTNKEMTDYVTEFWKNFEAEYCKVPTSSQYKNFARYADMESMVGVWLVNEIMGQDDQRNSRFSYIADNGKLYFGPVWDFDHGGASWSVTPATGLFYTLYKKNQSAYYRKWFPDPVLCQMTYDAYWNVARPFIMEYISEGGEMDADYSLFAEAGKTNDILWGSDHNPRTTKEDVEILRTFIQGHINWLDKQFQSVKTLVTAMNLRCVYPCDPDIVENGNGIQAPLGQGRESDKIGTRKVIQGKHLYIIKNGEAYSVDGIRVE